MIVDSHTHIWRASPRGASLVSTIVSGERDVHVGLLRKCLELCGVDRAVLVQPVYPGEDNSYVADTAAAEPSTLAAVCVVDPRRPDAAARLRYWVAERGCRGLRLRPKVRGEAEIFGDPTTYPLWETAAELKAVVSVLCDFEHLGTVARLAALFPDVDIVVDHLAHPQMPITPAAAAPLLRLAQFPRVYAKVSGFYYFSRTDYPHPDCVPLVRAVYDEFGPRRLLWGSDFPHVLLRTRYGRALALPQRAYNWLAPDELRLILGENAARLYWHA